MCGKLTHNGHSTAPFATFYSTTFRQNRLCERVCEPSLASRGKVHPTGHGRMQKSCGDCSGKLFHALLAAKCMLANMVKRQVRGHHGRATVFGKRLLLNQLDWRVVSVEMTPVDVFGMHDDPARRTYHVAGE